MSTSFLAMLWIGCIVESNPGFAGDETSGSPTTGSSSESSTSEVGSSEVPSSSSEASSSTSSDGGSEASGTGPVACSGAEVRRPTGDTEACYAPDPTLRAWWSFEGETLSEALSDEIDGQELLVFEGGRERVDSPLGVGLVLEHPYNALLPSSDALWSGASPTEGTLEAWVWLDPSVDESVELPDLLPIVYFGVPQGDGWGDQSEAHLHIFREQTDPTTYRWRAGMHVEGLCGADGDDVQVGQWVHLAATWTSTECTVYVGGIASGSASMIGTLLGGWTVARVGMAAEPLLQRTFRGAVDEIMIFDRARTSDEIRADCGDCE